MWPGGVRYFWACLGSLGKVSHGPESGVCSENVKGNDKGLKSCAVGWERGLQWGLLCRWDKDFRVESHVLFEIPRAVGSVTFPRTQRLLCFGGGVLCGYSVPCSTRFPSLGSCCNTNVLGLNQCTCHCLPHCLPSDPGPRPDPSFSAFQIIQRTPSLSSSCKLPCGLCVSIGCLGQNWAFLVGSYKV